MITTIFFLLLTSIIGLIYGFISLHPDIPTEEIHWLWILLLISGAVVFVRVGTYLIVDVFLTQSSKRKSSDLLRLVVNLILIGIASGLVLGFGFNQDLAALLTTSALITAVIGFALQATLGNFFSGVALEVEQPFKIGDIVEYDKELGQIESLTGRSVYIRTIVGTRLVVPNNKISEHEIEVFPVGDPIARWLRFSVRSNVSPQRVTEIVTKVISNLPYIDHSKRYRIRLLDFNRSQAQYLIIYFLRNFYFSRATDALIQERLWYAFARYGLLERQTVKRNDAHFLGLIAANPLFQNLSADDHQFLAESVKPLVFGPDEPITPDYQSQRSMYIVSRGVIQVHLTDTSMLDEAETVDYLLHNGSTPVQVSYWRYDHLDEITAELTEYIGPIADLLVREYATKTADPYWMYRLLAREIPNESEQKAFLKNSPGNPMEEINIGDYFGERHLLLGEIPTIMNIETENETELLEVSFQTMKELFQRNPQAAQIIAENFAKQQDHAVKLHMAASGTFPAAQIRQRLKSTYQL